MLALPTTAVEAVAASPTQSPPTQSSPDRSVEAEATDRVRPYPPLTDARAERVRAALERMRRDPRGPYLRVRWFCNDGTVLAPEPGACRNHGGGHQHAVFTDEARALADLGFHVGTILQSMSYEDFVDAEHGHYRLRELVLEQYLVEAHDGWVLRRARYYRGARQIEDEEQRGREFLVRLLDDPAWRARHPLLGRRLAAVVPHGQAGIPGERIRALATRIAELDPVFQDLRVKLHSRPGPDDLAAVRRFRERLPDAPSAKLLEALDELEAGLVALYPEDFDPQRWQALATELEGTPLDDELSSLAGRLAAAGARERVRLLSRLVLRARDLYNDQRIAGRDPDGGVALALLDLINYADSFLVAAANSWIQDQLALYEPEPGQRGAAGGDGAAPGSDTTSAAASREELIGFLADLVDAAYAGGWLTAREHGALSPVARLQQASLPSAAAATGVGSSLSDRAALPAARYHELVGYLGRAVDWAQGAIHQAYGMVLERYLQVEPAATGFRDDELRRSVLLPYAAAIDLLSRDADRAVEMLHEVFGVETAGQVFGLNAGVTIGRLRVIESLADLEDIRLEPTDICVLPETPADLGHVAGILTLDEGSRLSHVQLLARSMGIPNAVISGQLYPLLRSHAGEEVFYAVSRVGAVVLKRRSEMTDRDLAVLEEKASRPQERVAIDVEELDLTVTELLPLENVDLEDSGRLVGPKAANLGRLHRLFPDRVAPGLVIPFGVFRQHIDRDLLGGGRTLHEVLVEIYDYADTARASGADAGEVDRWVLERLEEVHRAIVQMELLPGFVADLRRHLAQRFGPPGTYGIFVRSDTNVEDLPSFTGAGLNLTMMNQIGTEAILEAIKKVWASPFTERSYSWRQKLVTDPEHVYPSLVLLRSVPVDASGVVATTDLTGNRPAIWTVTLSEGIGGVVEGEPAETTLVPAGGGEPVLLSSARSVWRKVLNPEEGGIDRAPVEGHDVLLTPERLADLRRVVVQVEQRYPTVPGEDGEPLPWDIEFGFVGDHVMLFQIRPLVTSRRLSALETLVDDLGPSEPDRSTTVDLREPPRPAGL